MTLSSRGRDTFSVHPKRRVHVSYSLWSRGRLIGHTDLAFKEQIEGQRGGFFFPTETGVPLTRIAVEAAEVLMEARDGIVDTTMAADLAAATDRCEALALELRGPDGAVISTTKITLQDTELLATWPDVDEDVSSAQLSPREQRALDAVVEHDLMILEEGLNEGWMSTDDEDDIWNEPEFPRYQIFVW